MDEPGARYTVRQLIAALEDFDSDSEVSAWSGCHDCGGKLLDVDGYVDGNGDKHVQIIGYDERLTYGDD